MRTPRHLIPVYAETDLEAMPDADLAALADDLDSLRRGIASDVRFVGASATMDAADSAAWRALVAIRRERDRRQRETEPRRDERRQRERDDFARRSQDAAWSRAIDRMDPAAADALMSDIILGGDRIGGAR